MEEIKKNETPIIFVINKCTDEVFNDEDEKEDLENEIAYVKKGTDFENYKTYCINCINGKGFDELLKGIFNHYEKYINEDNNVLLSIKNSSITLINLQHLFEHSFFLSGVSLKDDILFKGDIIKGNKLSMSYDYFYQLFLSYKKAIEGFLKIIEDMKIKGNNLNDFVEPSLIEKLKMEIAIEKKLNKFIDY